MNTSSSPSLDPPLGRDGFTLVELLITAVIGLILLGATYQILVTNQRVYTVQQARISNQQTVRAGLNVLASELREISAVDGDVLSLAAGSVSIRSMRAFGSVCNVLGPTDLVIQRKGRTLNVDDEVVIFAENDPATRADDTFVEGRITAMDGTAACAPGVPAMRVGLDPISANFGANIVLGGAPIRAYRSFEYGPVAYAGQTYLGRTPAGGTAEPLVGPIAAVGGVTFEYFDAAAAPTNAATNVAEIRITLRTESPVRDTGGELVSDTLTTRVFLRN